MLFQLNISLMPRKKLSLRLPRIAFVQHGDAAQVVKSQPPKKMSAQISPKWLKASLSCPEAALEAATDLLGVLSGSAVEQTPVKDGMSVISGFFQLDQEEQQKQILSRLDHEMAELFGVYGLDRPSLEHSLLADQDWATSWQQFFSTFAIVPGLIIKPSWESYVAGPGEQVIEMDPGMAFGTGQHASTKLALRLIQECFSDESPENILDIGTGTGILAMAAILFGARKAIAIDNDPEAVQVATENIAQNSLEQKIVASATDLAELNGSFDLICANILHDVLLEMAPAIVQLLAVNGKVVLAGILRGEQEESIVRVYGGLGLALQRTACEDDWASLLLARRTIS